MLESLFRRKLGTNVVALIKIYLMFELESQFELTSIAFVFRLKFQVRIGLKSTIKFGYDFDLKFDLKRGHKFKLTS